MIWTCVPCNQLPIHMLKNLMPKVRLIRRWDLWQVIKSHRWRQSALFFFFFLRKWHRSILFYFIFPFIFISGRLITLQYCSGFCHTLTWISHGFTCIPHPDPPSHLPLYPIPLGPPSAPALSTCLMHPTWAGDLFHPR